MFINKSIVLNYKIRRDKRSSTFKYTVIITTLFLSMRMLSNSRITHTP